MPACIERGCRAKAYKFVSIAGISVMDRESSEGVAAIDHIQQDSDAARLQEEELLSGSDSAGLLSQLSGDKGTNTGSLNQSLGRKQPSAVLGAAAPAAQLDSRQPNPKGLASPAGVEPPGGKTPPPSTFAVFRQTSLKAAVGLQVTEIHAEQPVEHLHQSGKSTRPQLLALAEQPPGSQPDSAKYRPGSSGQGLLADMAGEAATVEEGEPIEEGEPGAANSRAEDALNATGGGAASFSGRIDSQENR